MVPVRSSTCITGRPQLQGGARLTSRCSRIACTHPTVSACWVELPFPTPTPSSASASVSSPSSPSPCKQGCHANWRHASVATTSVPPRAASTQPRHKLEESMPKVRNPNPKVCLLVRVFRCHAAKARLCLCWCSDVGADQAGQPDDASEGGKPHRLPRVCTPPAQYKDLRQPPGVRPMRRGGGGGGWGAATSQNCHPVRRCCGCRCERWRLRV